MAKDYVDLTGTSRVSGIDRRALTVKTARIYYFNNYMLTVLVLFLASIIYTKFNLTFYFIPRTFWELANTMLTFGFVAILAYLIQEAEIERAMRKYIITNNEVAKAEGVIRKSRVSLPHANISDIRVQKGVIGRIFNFGDIDVVGFKGQIKIKGIKNPEMIHRVIETKIAGLKKRRGYEREDIEVVLRKEGPQKIAKKKRKK